MIHAIALAISMVNLATNDIQIDWGDNRLRILSPRLPGGKIDTWWFEAFCRSGSTNRKWEETTIPHRTVRIGASGPTKEINLVSTVEPKVKVTHRLKVMPDGIRIDLEATNEGTGYVDVVWAQPCIQLAGFTGADQESYIKKSFIFTGSASKPELKLLSDLPRTEEAIYKGGQVYVPKGIDRADVNPRPLSTITPAINLIGCYSADDKMVLGLAWDQTQELFQGVIVCLHSDFRIGGLRPGETKRIHGRMYLIDKDVSKLLRLYRRDFPTETRRPE